MNLEKKPKVHALFAENFRCLRAVQLQFAPLTVLVGPNAAGKTTILEALNLSSG